MDLNKLRYFITVAETEHVTKAANLLGISQPALTRSLRRLEEELGVTLIVGAGRNIRLTAEGAFLYQQSVAAMQSLTRAEQAVRSFSERTQHTIDICIESASALVVDAIAAYSSDRPQLAFAVSQEDDARLSDIVVSSFARSSAQQSSSFTERIGIAIPRALRAAFPKRLALADLSEAHFICLAGNRGFRRQCDELCKQRGFIAQVIFESDNPSVVRKMIGAGLGVGFWPEHSWGPVESEKTEWIALAESDFERTIAIELTSQGMEKRAAKDFRTFLLTQFERAWEAPAS